MNKFITSLFFYLQHKIKTLFTSGKVIDIKDKKVIVSFTTLPSRFPNIEETLISLINQTRLPDEIVISIPKYSVREDTQYIVPNIVKKIIEKNKKSSLFIKVPDITILRSDKDWGPATKFIPLLQRELNKEKNKNLLIILDDDQVYQRTMISNFIKYHKKHNKSVLCNRGRILKSDFIYNNSDIILSSKIKTPKPVDIITGVGAYLLIPDMFNSTIWDYEGAPKGAFYMDDIWISGYLAKNNIERLTIPVHSELLIRSKRDLHKSRVFKGNKKQKDTITLSEIPCDEAEENPREFYNNSVIKYYKDYWK